MPSTQRTNPPASSEPPRDSHLEGRYRRIGISAVAAALPYCGDAKNPAYAPAVPADDKPRDPIAA
jgi:hypothetical protein